LDAARKIFWTPQTERDAGYAPRYKQENAEEKYGPNRSAYPADEARIAAWDRPGPRRRAARGLDSTRACVSCHASPTEAAEARRKVEMIYPLVAGRFRARSSLIKCRARVESW